MLRPVRRSIQQLHSGYSLIFTCGDASHSQPRTRVNGLQPVLRVQVSETIVSNRTRANAAPPPGREARSNCDGCFTGSLAMSLSLGCCIGFRLVHCRGIARTLDPGCAVRHNSVLFRWKSSLAVAAYGAIEPAVSPGLCGSPRHSAERRWRAQSGLSVP